MLEKAAFLFNKCIFYLKLKPKDRKMVSSINSPEKYVEFLAAEEQKYTPSDYKITDENAHSEADIDNLFSQLNEYAAIRESYDFPYNAAHSDMENALNIMEYLTAHTFYCGLSLCIIPDNTQEILKYSFDRGFSHRINCRFKAIAFTDILNAYGIKALPICMISGSGGCHFTVHVYLREENRFAVFDPSFNCCFADENGRAMSVFELRECFAEDNAVNVIGYDLFGTEQFKETYKFMFIKDCLENISTWNTNQRNSKINSKIMGIKFETAVPKSI